MNTSRSNDFSNFLLFGLFRFSELLVAIWFCVVNVRQGIVRVICLCRRDQMMPVVMDIMAMDIRNYLFMEDAFNTTIGTDTVPFGISMFGLFSVFCSSGNVRSAQCRAARR